MQLIPVAIRRVLGSIVADQGRDAGATIQGWLVEDKRIGLIVMRFVIVGLARQDSAHLSINQTCAAIAASLSTFDDQP
jgi:hypothetical protein